MQCHWNQTTIVPPHLPRKTAISNNTEGERGREREKQTGRDGKRRRVKGRWREIETEGQRKRYKGKEKESQYQIDSLQSPWRSRLEGRRNRTAPLKAMMMLGTDWRRRADAEEMWPKRLSVYVETNIVMSTVCPLMSFCCLSWPGLQPYCWSAGNTHTQ